MENIHHIVIPVTDVERALGRYGERLDCETVYADSSWALLRFANVSLAIVSPDQHPPHFAVERVDAQAYGAWTSHRDGTASVYIRDPWDNAIEVMKPAEAGGGL